jgi:hypothetical protein
MLVCSVLSLGARLLVGPLRVARSRNSIAVGVVHCVASVSSVRVASVSGIRVASVSGVRVALGSRRTGRGRSIALIYTLVSLCCVDVAYC